MPAVVGPEDHDGVIGITVSFEGVEELADLGIDEAGAGEVAARQVHPFIVIDEPLVAWLGEGPVHVPREAGGVGPVVLFDERESGVFFGVEVEPLFGGEAGNVREEEAGGEEEGSLGFVIENFNGPFGDFVVTFVFVPMWEKAPIYEFHRTWGVDQFFLGEGRAGGSGSEVVEFLISLFTPVVAVVNFSRGVGGVAVCFEVLGEGDEVLEFIELSEPGAEAVDAGVVRPHAHHETGAGGITKGGLAMGVEKGGPTGG